MSNRTRSDRCPGALRPWHADDGMLVRLRLIAGRLPSTSLRTLLTVAETYGDGRVYLTARANLQVRGLPGADGVLHPEVLAALETTGLVPTRTHELVRNVMVSPQSGLSGGHADLRPVAAELDRLLCADERLAALPGRFLFVLDDGRGDLVERPCDLGLVALDDTMVQLRVGAGWGPVVPLVDAATRLVALAAEFTRRRGSGPAAPWHVVELGSPLLDPAPADARIPAPSGPLPYGRVSAGRHVAVPDGTLDRAAVDGFTAAAPVLIITPWRGVLIPEERQ
jgi:sulfite reductase beta subunit-like hemoprotein